MPCRKRGAGHPHDSPGKSTGGERHTGRSAGKCCACLGQRAVGNRLSRSVVYPAEKGLSEAIPDSEWVKVNYDGEDYYVVGRLKDNGKVRFLGYGVPGKESVKPPKAADGIAQWFPLSGMDGYDGYWLFFQDAETGKIDG